MQPTILDILDDEWVSYDAKIEGKSSIFRLLKELIVRRGKVKKEYSTVVKSTDTLSSNEQLKVFDWMRDNISGCWHVILFLSNDKLLAQGQFNRKEDAIAFKLMWT